MVRNEETGFFNGKIVTLDSNDTIAKAVMIKNGRILCVGSDEEVRRAASETATKMDLKGKTMLPGFIDSHCHLAKAARSYAHYLDGRCPPNKSISDILERIEKRTKEIPKDQWVIVHGSFFGYKKLKEKRYPTKEELDSVAPKHPVLIINSRHSFILNTPALKIKNITKDSQGVAKGIIERNKITGEPTGVCVECPEIFPDLEFDLEQLKQELKVVMREKWVNQGFTSASSFTDNLELRAHQELLQDGSLPLRIQAMIFDNQKKADALENVIRLGIVTGLGNDWLKIGGIKIFLDGAFLGLSAATHQPYLNLSDHNYCGVLLMQPEILNQLVLKAHNAGNQICLHAMGDKAQDMALDAYEAAFKKNPRPHRHRIEHFGVDMGSSEQRRRARELNILPNITIGFLYGYGDFIEYYLGPDRRDQSFALRSIIDAGLMPANSSDETGSDWLTLDPFFCIWCAVTRQTYFGNRFVPEQAISVKEALRLWTINAAYSGFEEGVKGSIEPGKFADLIVLSHDILTIPEDQIKDIKVEKTILDGKIVYQR
jgi:predicted amidohydrolase YtcJ